MRSKLTILVALALAGTAIAAIPASEHGEEGPTPTTITTAEVNPTGPAAWEITGTVDYGGQAPVVLGTDATGDAPPNGTGHTAGLGLDLTQLVAYASDGDEPVVTLEWHATALDQLPPPELIRYYWQVEIGLSGGWAFQAKTSDVVSAANLGDGEPETIAGNVASYAGSTVPSFRIRGNCGNVTVGPVSPASNCGHVAWVDGEFDFDANVVRFFLPLDLDNAAAIRPGAVLTAVENGTYAAIQAVADIGNTRDTIAQEVAYTIPERTASVSLVDADGELVKAGTLTVADDSSISGGLDAGAIAPGAYRLDVTACFAANCDTDTRTVTVS
ncbi:MAG: hypothetical protein KY469_18845 [Actinobacteria bacterium]|nr:hypothetical protein [Actinomycetota bacterium]